MSKKIDLTGQRFGRLVVICENGLTKRGQVLWLCQCDCGAEIIVSSDSLRRGNTQSCGCFKRDRTVECHTSHGMTKTRLYKVWQNMLRRTGALKGADEETKRIYQDRCITVCTEWRSFESFRDWSLSHDYSDDLQIDRIDNDKGYCPENCRWATCKENTNNRRNTLRLSDGTSLAMFCSGIGIQTVENGKLSKQYNKYKAWFKKHNGEGHPELVQKANNLISTMSKCLRMLELLNDVRAFREQLYASVSSYAIV